MLFATLETSTRHIKIKNHDCLLTDTVGFIERLPHHLIQAFRSTLEEVKEAGWTLEKSTFDLHHSEYVEGNIMTEYEEKFVAKGNPICMLQIFLQEDK